jgi:hypothetical protein
MNVTRKYRFAGAAVAVAALAWSGTAAAAPVLLTMGKPDITSLFLTVDYNGAGTFTVSGTPWTYAPDTNPAHLIDMGPTPSSLQDFVINMTINPATGVPTGGTLDIEGDIPGVADGDLLTGTISEFGFPTLSGKPNFEFVFTNLGGLLAPAFGGSAGHANIIVSQTDVSFSGSFGAIAYHDDTGMSAQSDTAASPTSVPAPAAVWAGLALLGGCALVRGGIRAVERKALA